MRFGIVILLLTAPVAAVAESRVEIRAVEGMRFEPRRATAPPGNDVVIAFENADATDQPHNFVLCRPGSLKAVLDAALALGAEGPAKDFLPASDLVLGASKLIKAGDRAEVRVTLPKEPGVYPYVCTFPGHGFLMFGALYAGVPMPAEKDDPNIPKATGPAAKSYAPDPRPMVRRIFLPDCGPAGIAVALPGTQNLAWDAGTCRLRYAWDGGFLDAEEHLRTKGSPLAKPLGPVWWRSTEPTPLRPGGNAPTRTTFRGYDLAEKLPTFRYEVDGVTVTERFEPAEGGFLRKFALSGLTAPLEVALDSGAGVEITTSAGQKVGTTLRLTPAEAASFELRYRRVR